MDWCVGWLAGGWVGWTITKVAPVGSLVWLGLRVLLSVKPNSSLAPTPGQM